MLPMIVVAKDLLVVFMREEGLYENINLHLTMCYFWYRMTHHSQTVFFLLDDRTQGAYYPGYGLVFCFFCVFFFGGGF